MAPRDQGLMGQYAGMITRAVALIIDILIVIVAVLIISAAITLPLDFFLNVNPASCGVDPVQGTWLQRWPTIFNLLCNFSNRILLAVAILTGPVYFIFLATAGGQTVGKYVMGVRIVSENGKPMGYGKATLRWLGYFVSLIPLGLGFAWVVVDDRRRGFHDKIAGTCVIYAWRAHQNEYLLARVQRFFGRVSKHTNLKLEEVLATQNTELVMLAVPGYGELRGLIQMVQGGSQTGRFQILGVQEYAKSGDGILSRIDDMEFAMSPATFSEAAGLSADRLQQIQTEIPVDSFVLAALVTEVDADALVKEVSRRTTAQVRRYDLGRARATATQTPTGARTSVAVAPAAAAAPAAGATIGAQAPVIPSAVPTSAGPAQLEHLAAAPLSAPVLEPDKAATASAQAAILSPAVSAADHAPFATWQRRYPSLLQLGEELAALPEFKASAINDAIGERAIPQLVAAPQDLNAIKGIGPVLEQRLYRAGVGTYWEVASLSDDDLRRIFALTEFQSTQVDLAAIRADARRLAVSSGTIGHFWQGPAPDDFEPIDGIGPVFEQRLYAAGIRTYADLAGASAEQLAQIVKAPKPSQPDFASWIEQAQHLAQTRA